MFEPAALFEVADGELDGGVVAVEGVHLHGVAVEVGEEGEVAPVGPQAKLAGIDQSGAT
ncbi:MAG TPA: hypothetical protein VK988_16925 [Acidimicrobiales bacterium]|nr:hypothetical protein [Acidimicrobiales bacterium]